MYNKIIIFNNNKLSFQNIKNNEHKLNYKIIETIQNYIFFDLEILSGDDLVVKYFYTD